MISTKNDPNYSMHKFNRVGTDSFTAPSPNTLIRYDEKIENQKSDSKNPDQSSINAQKEIKKEKNQSDQFDDLLISILSGERTVDSIDVDQLPHIIQALKENRDHRINHGDINGTEKTDEILFSARQCYNKKIKDNAINDRLACLDNRIAEANDELNTAKRNYLMNHAELEELHKKQIRELGQRQIFENDHLRKLWNSRKYQSMYNKPSPELRTLQLQATFIHHDKGLQLERQKAEKQTISLYKTEQKEKSRLMNTHFQEAMKNLERKQKNDLNILLQKQKEKTEELCMRETEEIRRREIRLKNLLKEKEELSNSSHSFKHILSENQKSGNKKNQKSQENKSKKKPYFADFVKLPLPSLSLTSPRRAKLKAPRYSYS